MLKVPGQFVVGCARKSVGCQYQGIGLTEIIFVPHSLALVAQLSPHDSSSIELRQRIVELLRQRVDKPVCIHYAQRASDYTAHTGSFRAWGAPQVTVGAGNHSPELIARYLLADAGHAGEISTQPVLEAGGDIVVRAGWVNLVLIDAVAGLTIKAPKYLRPTAAATHQWCVQVLSEELPATCLTLEELAQAGVDNPMLWLSIYALRATAKWQPDSCYVDTTHGVARFIATWSELAEIEQVGTKQAQSEPAGGAEANPEQSHAPQASSQQPGKEQV